MKDLSGRTDVRAGSSIDMIRQSFSEGFAEGRGIFLRKLLKEKWIEVADIEKLYSSGLLEPDILEDITIGELAKLTGLRIDLARRIKDMVLGNEMDLSPEFEKKEVEKVKSETAKIKVEIDASKAELEKLEKEYHVLRESLTCSCEEREKTFQEIRLLKGKEKEGYLKEKRLQDEVIFILDERKKHHNRAEKERKELESARGELEKIRKEFLFTQGECRHLLEKIDYLVNRLDTALHAKEVSRQNVEGFLSELKRVHDRLEDTSRRSLKTYYVNKG